MTQLTLLYKVEKFYANRHRIKRIEKILRSSLFCPKSAEEDVVIKESMVLTFQYFMLFYISALLTILMWAVTALTEEKKRLPVSAW